jgi:hypothetical protein
VSVQIGPAIELVLQEAERESVRPANTPHAPVHGTGHAPTGSRRDPLPRRPTLEELRTWLTCAHAFTFSDPSDARIFAQLVEASMSNEAVIIHSSVEFSAEIGAQVGFAVWRQSKTALIDAVEGSTAHSVRHNQPLPTIPNKVTR